MKKSAITENIDKFRETGLLLFINQFLHIFGWAIIVVTDNNENLIMYPNKVNCRGFSERSVDNAYKKLAKYISDNHQEFTNIDDEINDK